MRAAGSSSAVEIEEDDLAIVVLGGGHGAAEPQQRDPGRIAGSYDRPEIVSGGVLGDRGPAPRRTGIRAPGMEDLMVFEGGAVAGVDGRGDVEGVQVVRVDRDQTGVVVLVRQQPVAGSGQLTHLPSAAWSEARVEEAVIRHGVLTRERVLRLLRSVVPRQQDRCE